MTQRQRLATISLQRLHIVLRGVVQGVGFRPFVYRLATELRLSGWVMNSAAGVELEVEGARSQLDRFVQRLPQELPTHATIHQMETSAIAPIGDTTFEIRASLHGKKRAIILPDLATCPECLREVLDPDNRRYRYPFTTCTHCGPRFSIVQTLPYDRPSTTMQGFRMCAQCQLEYDNPLDRRFHAQPNACPVCGPHLEGWSAHGAVLATHEAALQLAAKAIRQGNIVAVKGLGGFHLMADSRNGTAVQRLRQVKQRKAKPFALMYPSLNQIRAHCCVSAQEELLLRSPMAPIVLLQRRPHTADGPHEAVAPDNPNLGVMLPYTPLHHLLLEELGFPVVATSGNRADEPICTHEHEALERLGNLADLFLVHNRPIAHPIDDSIVRVMVGRVSVLRRARGYAPLPIPIPAATHHQPESQILAVGAHLKSAIAFSLKDRVFVSQHIGDLDTRPAVEALQHAIASFESLYELRPTAIACDAHPDYQSTRVAQALGQQLSIPVIPVQHHHAHILAAMAEHQLTGSVLGIAWDGSGYGLDGSIWGSEILHIRDLSVQRVAHLRPFPLLGGNAAIKEPRRSAIGLLYEVFGNDVFDRQDLAPIHACSIQELRIFRSMLNQGLNTPATSSMGRLFDAIASLTGLLQYTQFEGQAAMAIESAIAQPNSDTAYTFAMQSGPGAIDIMDWKPMVTQILEDMVLHIPISQIATKFHNTLVHLIVHMAQQIGEHRVVLSGGCFQNKYLLERTIQSLTAHGMEVHWPQTIPSNDGGIALGQIMAVLRMQPGGA
ncbi:carbamoyltransferase HypF [Leptolyngbya sp. AN02str]|uniref:carbamoyltransferase HypF n=1 Tax=Leptolyngbya sp. AN02str TaxID=3423363 RepID=UPI003D31C1AA